MSRNERQLSIKLFEGRFNLEDAMGLTQQEIDLFPELDAEAIQATPDEDKTAEERLFEQRILARLIAHIAQK